MSAPQPIRRFLAEMKANPRLRWGVWAIVGIVWLYGVLELRDASQRQTEAYRAASRKLVQAQTIATQGEWPARLEQVNIARLELESRLWKAGTPGLAQATFNDWLAQLALQSSLARSQIAVSAQEDGPSGREAGDKGSGAVPGLWKVSARLSFDFAPPGFHRLMAQLATRDQRVVIESLTIRGVPNPRAEMLLVAYFQKPAAPAPLPASGGMR